MGYNVSYHELPKLDQQGAVKHGGGAYYLYLPTFLPSLPPSQSTGIGAYPDPAVGSASQAGLSPVSFHRFCMSQVYVCSARRIYWLYRLIALRYWTIARSHHLRLIAQVLLSSSLLEHNPALLRCRQLRRSAWLLSIDSAALSVDGGANERSTDSANPSIRLCPIAIMAVTSAVTCTCLSAPLLVANVTYESCLRNRDHRS